MSEIIWYLFLSDLFHLGSVFNKNISFHLFLGSDGQLLCLLKLFLSRCILGLVLDLGRNIILTFSGSGNHVSVMPVFF